MNKLAYYKKLYKLIKTQQFIEACYLAQFLGDKFQFQCLSTEEIPDTPIYCCIKYGNQIDEMETLVEAYYNEILDDYTDINGRWA